MTKAASLTQKLLEFNTTYNVVVYMVIKIGIIQRNGKTASLYRPPVAELMEMKHGIVAPNDPVVQMNPHNWFLITYLTEKDASSRSWNGGQCLVFYPYVFSVSN